MDAYLKTSFFALYNGLLATVARQSWGLVVKFSAYTEFKAMFERASGEPDKPLAPWKHGTYFFFLLYVHVFIKVIDRSDHVFSV